MNQRFDDFVTGITVCYKYLQKIKSVVVNDLGLKGSHVMCMFYLSQHPEGLTAARLCSLCAEDKAAISRTVAFLRDQGYVVSSGGKNYRAGLCLTDAGKEVARQFDCLISQWVTIGGEGLQEQERRDFYHSLRLISNNLRIHMEQDPKFNEV